MSEQDQVRWEGFGLDPVFEAERRRIAENESDKQPKSIDESPQSDSQINPESNGQPEKTNFVSPGSSQTDEESPPDAQAQHDAPNREPELTESQIFEERFEKLKRSVVKHPLNREVFYKILDACQIMKRDEEIEDLVRDLPEFKSAVLDEYTFLKILVREGGLDMDEYDEGGNLIQAVEEQAKSQVIEENELAGQGPVQTSEVQGEGQNTNEAQSRTVAWRTYLTTELGRHLVDELNPAHRLRDLLSLVPARKDFYLKVLDFCKEGKRSYQAIEALLHDDLLAAMGEETFHISTKPSVFIDKLERSGGIVWNNGWSITDTGRRVLETISGG